MIRKDPLDHANRVPGGVEKIEMLRELERKQRASHVRIVWLGDSHGAADFWSGAVRTALQERFGGSD